MTTIVLTGNTYPHRKTIASIEGARWDATEKAWIVVRRTMRQWADAQAAAYALRKQGVTVTTR